MSKFERVQKLKETVVTLEQIVKDVENAANSDALGYLENRGQAALQLAEVEVMAAGVDLREAVVARRFYFNHTQAIDQVARVHNLLAKEEAPVAADEVPAQTEAAVEVTPPKSKKTKKSKK